MVYPNRIQRRGINKRNKRREYNDENERRGNNNRIQRRERDSKPVEQRRWVCRVNECQKRLSNLHSPRQHYRSQHGISLSAEKKDKKRLEALANAQAQAQAQLQAPAQVRAQVRVNLNAQSQIQSQIQAQAQAQPQPQSLLQDLDQVQQEQAQAQSTNITAKDSESEINHQKPTCNAVVCLESLVDSLESGDSLNAQAQAQGRGQLQLKPQRNSLPLNLNHDDCWQMEPLVVHSQALNANKTGNHFDSVPSLPKIDHRKSDICNEDNIPSNSFSTVVASSNNFTNFVPFDPVVHLESKVDSFALGDSSDTQVQLQTQTQAQSFNTTANYFDFVPTPSSEIDSQKWDTNTCSVAPPSLFSTNISLGSNFGIVPLDPVVRQESVVDSFALRDFWNTQTQTQTQTQSANSSTNLSELGHQKFDICNGDSLNSFSTVASSNNFLNFVPSDSDVRQADSFALGDSSNVQARAQAQSTNATTDYFDFVPTLSPPEIDRQKYEKFPKFNTIRTLDPIICLESLADSFTLPDSSKAQAKATIDLDSVPSLSTEIAHQKGKASHERRQDIKEYNRRKKHHLREQHLKYQKSDPTEPSRDGSFSNCVPLHPIVRWAPFPTESPPLIDCSTSQYSS
eukprot:Awhi_evm1s7608